MEKRNWDECRERYSAFWSGAPIDRPPLLFDAIGVLANPMYRGAGYDYTKYGQDIGAFRDDYMAVWEARAECRDDTVPCISPQMGGAIEPAFWAGEVEWGTEVSSLRPVAPLARTPDLGSIRFELRNDYYLRALREIDFLSATVGGRCGVNLEQGLSITSTISQLIGAERYLLAAYDEPMPMRMFAERVAGQLLELLAQVKRRVPLPDGGTCHRWLNYWNPGWGFWFSEDDAILLSPAIYRDLFLDLDARLCEACDCAVIHWHSGGMRLFDLISRLPRLRMVQISLDPTGEDFESVLSHIEPFVRRGGKVCFQIEYDPNLLHAVFHRIGYGSCIFYLVGRTRDVSHANAIVGEVERLCRSAAC